jgi:hypothetical protein
MKLNNASHWFAAILATFVLCIGLQGCSQSITNPAAVTSTNIQSQLLGIGVAQRQLLAAIQGGLISVPAAIVANGYINDAHTAATDARTAYEAGNTSLANTYLTEAVNFAAKIGVIPKVAPATAAPTAAPTTAP